MFVQLNLLLLLRVNAPTFRISAGCDGSLRSTGATGCFKSEQTSLNHVFVTTESPAELLYLRTTEVAGLFRRNVSQRRWT